MVGKVIAHYLVLREIGAGGMGQVYLARDEKDGREVALKLLPHKRVSDPDMRGRFLHEARAQALLSHPNVATFYEVGEDAGHAYIAMEYVQGSSLDAFMGGREVSPLDAIDLSIGICEGLRAAHAKGVVHRDVKPSNVLLTADGQPKLTDFGLARFKGATTLTKSGHVIGTARYMSPEQAEGRRVDHRTDLFSLGIVLYELLCRRVPFDGDSDAVVLFELLTSPPQPLSRYCRNVPPELEQVITRLLAKNPSDRYQSADETAVDLRQVRQLIVAGGAERIRLTQSHRRRRLGRALYGAGAFATLGVFGLYLFLNIQERTARTGPHGIAVLAFRNLGSSDRAFFADGMTDELTTQLASIDRLRVVSRTSASRFKEGGRHIREVGSELGVDYVLEGAVLWDTTGPGNRFRVSPQLIRVEDESLVWTSTYDRTLYEILLTQSEIAETVTQEIGRHLGIELQTSGRGAPTANLAAYEYYLRGSEYLNRGFDGDDLLIAIEQFERAVALDSGFAAAFARLSRAHSKYFWFQEETADRLALARESGRTSLRLGPNLPEAHLAMGYCLYWGDRDFDRALDEFTMVRNLEPSNPDAPFAIGGILRRRGRFEEALQSFSKASELDPLSSNRAFEVGNTFYHMRRCHEADSCFARAIALAPDEFPAYSRRVLNALNCDGNTTTARRIVDGAFSRFGAEAFAPHLFEIYRLDKQFDSALVLLESSRHESQAYFASAAKIHDVAGDSATADAYYDSARVILETQAKSSPDDPDLQADLGVAYAGLGRVVDAVQSGRRAVELLPMTKDAFGGPYQVERLAQIFVMVNQPDSALAQLETLLAANYPASKKLVRLDTDWAPLWNNPRFQALTR